MPGNYASDYQLVREVMQSKRVRAKLAEVAQRGVPVTDARAAAERVAARAQLTHGTRPRGRPYSRIALNGTTEWGDYRTPRRRVLASVASILRGGR
jgi:hypothetical protein